MARAHHVKKARKAIKGTDIKKGDSYYWWKFRRGGKHFSKTPPRRSQLTRSEFYAAIYDIEDEIAGLTADETLSSVVEDIASRLRELGEECQSKFDNMPEGLQQGDTGQLLEERVSACESMADEFESLDFDDKEDDETDEEYWERKLEEVQAVDIQNP